MRQLTWRCCCAQVRWRRRSISWTSGRSDRRLGQDNIDRGFNAIKIGFLAVIIFMAIYYRAFGLIANVALLSNVVFIVAMLSILGASLTLPGIAGIVLTVGMAVDANVLIFERIREELAAGSRHSRRLIRVTRRRFRRLSMQTLRP